MSIETELLGILDKNISERSTKSRNTEIIAYFYGFRDAAWPTLDETARQFGDVSRERIRQILDQDFRRPAKPQDIQSIYILTELLSSRSYWRVSDLEGEISGRELAGNNFSIKGIFNLIEDLGIPNEFAIVSPDLIKATRSSIELHDNNFVVRDSDLQQVRSLLKKAEKLPGRCIIANLQILEDELGEYHGLISELIINSENVWAQVIDDQFWYVFENRDNRLINYSEKIFSVITGCDSARLSHVYRNALDARASRYPYPPESIIEEYLKSSVYFQNEDGYLQYIGETSELTDIEKDIVTYLQEHSEVSFSEFRSHLQSKGYGHPHIVKATNTSPLVFVDKSAGRKLYTYSLTGSAEPEIKSTAFSERYKKYLVRLRKMLEAGTDETVEQKTRKEQRVLQDWLFKDKKQEKCAICGNNYSVRALVTAHKKKRAKCLDAERLDPNIVMPVCNMGCDYLYENMFIYIEDGIVKKGNEVPNGADEFKVIDKLVGRKIETQWLVGPSSYFQLPEKTH